MPYGPDRDEVFDEDTVEGESAEEKHARLLREQGEINHRIPRETRIAYIAAADRILEGNTPEDWRD